MTVAPSVNITASEYVYAVIYLFIYLFIIRIIHTVHKKEKKRKLSYSVQIDLKKASLILKISEI